MQFHETQIKVATDKHRFRVLCCGRRWGKTTLAIEEIKGLAGQRKARIAYISTTYQQARDIAWEKLKNDCAQAGEINESRLEISLKNRSKIFLRGWESVETLRGQQFDLIVLDEVAMMRNFQASWQEVLRPTLTDTKGEALFISTPKGFNHFYELFNQQDKDKDYKSFHFTTYDNPHIPRDEINKAEQELTEDRFAQEYKADFRKTEGLVYKEFDRGIHLFDGEPENQVIKTLIGIDPGFTNPCGMLTIKKDRDSNYWVTDEWYKTQQTDAQIADYAAALGGNEYYADPENAGFREELKRRRVNVREVIKGKGSVEKGINTVRELFKQGRLNIHTSLGNLIWELETYSYPEKKSFQNEPELPIKENDHLLDALRYALMMDAHRRNLEQHRPPGASYVFDAGNQRIYMERFNQNEQSKNQAR